MTGYKREVRPGVWQLQIHLGYDAKGKRQRTTSTFHGGERSADRELRRLMRGRDAGNLAAPSRLTVAQYLERYLADYAAAHWTGKTRENAEQLIGNHIVPLLGPVQLSRLKPIDIQKAQTYWLASGRRDGTGGLSRTTARHLHRLLHGALVIAVKWELIERNPVDRVDAPKPQRYEPKPADFDVVGSILSAAAQVGGNTSIAVLLAATTGMRRGEIAGLKWDHVDLEKGSILVSQSMMQTKSGLQVKTPKSGKSRTVPIPGQMIKALLQHRAGQAQKKLFLGDAYRDEGWVIASPTGRRSRPDSISHAFRDLLRKNSLPPMRFHDLRHSHASQLLDQGEDLKVISERLGHSGIGITADLYTRLLGDRDRQAADRLGDALQKAMDRQRGLR